MRKKRELRPLFCHRCGFKLGECTERVLLPAGVHPPQFFRVKLVCPCGKVRTWQQVPGWNAEEEEERLPGRSG